MKHPTCDPAEVALKNYFLGPQAENGPWLVFAVTHLLERWYSWRKSLYPRDGQAISAEDQTTAEYEGRRHEFERLLDELATAFENEVPKFTPRYIGHMFSEISLPAFLGHFVTLMHNPNNISAEASRVGVRIEDEAVKSLIAMVGYNQMQARGHFTSGGTLANFEALVRARARLNASLYQGLEKRRRSLSVPLSLAASPTLFESAHKDPATLTTSKTHTAINPFSLARELEAVYGVEYRGPIILASKSRHYSWDKGVALLGYGCDALWGVELDDHGRMSVSDLESKIAKAAAEHRPILMIVSVAGTTECGTIDNIHEIAALLERWKARGFHFWHHVDAAYGGFFRTLPPKSEVLSTDNHRALDAIPLADSITLDPHKLGYVPYASGAFLCRTREDYGRQFIDAPYIDFRHDNDRGPLTIEGSRSAGGAVATWLTSRCIGFDADGYGRIIERTIRAAARMERLLRETSSEIRILPNRDSNVVCFTLARDRDTLRTTNARTLKLYDAFSPAHNGPFFVSKTNLRREVYMELFDRFTGSWRAIADDQEVTLIRLCMMNPFHDSREMKDLSAEFATTLKDFIDGRHSP